MGVSAAAYACGVESVAQQAAQSIRHPLTRALLTLTFTTGLIDGVSYLGLGHVFTANMTGNVVLLGFGLAGGTGLPVIAPIVSLVAFLLGALAGGELARRTSARHPRHAGSGLAIETALLIACAAIAAALTVHPKTFAADAVIALLAFAMGVRNATVRSFAVPDLTTTVLTLTLTGLAADWRINGGSAAATHRRIGAASAMLIGAFAGAMALKVDMWLPLAAAAALALVTGLLYVPAAARRASAAASAEATESQAG